MPATVLWAGLGAGLAYVRGSVALAIGIAYACLFGAVETARLPIKVPSSTWQVPSPWIRNRGQLVRMAIWGLFLGPGLATRNPYAGMWLVPILLALSDGWTTGALAGGLAGFAHGLARALATLQLMPRLGASSTSTAMVLHQLRWRLADGIALSVVAGFLLMEIV